MSFKSCEGPLRRLVGPELFSLSATCPKTSARRIPNCAYPNGRLWHDLGHIEAVACIMISSGVPRSGCYSILAGKEAAKATRSIQVSGGGDEGHASMLEHE